MIKFEIAPKSTEIESNWYDARLYCFALNIDGKTGWRLPTVEELKLFSTQVNDLIGWYWAADEYDADKAYDANFLTVLTTEYSPENKYYDNNKVRAVRDLPLNIEVGPESDKLMTYNEAQMYCFCFTQDGKIGWRLPTKEENDSIGSTIGNWYQDDPLKDDADEFWAVTPVRDLKDD